VSAARSDAAPVPISDILFELAPDAILVVDQDGRLLRVNAQAERIFGYARGEVVGQPLEIFIPERLRAAHVGHRTDFAHQPRTRDMGLGMELIGRRKDGTEFPVAVALAPVLLDDKPGVIAIARDVTVQKAADRVIRESEQRLAGLLVSLQRAHDQLEARVAERTQELSDANQRLREEQEKLIRAEKLSSLGVLASGVAHEINNPLSGVMGLVKSLRDGAVAEARKEQYFSTILDGLERMRLTVQGMLDYARLRPPSRAAFDAREMIESCLRLIAPATRKKDLEVEVAVPAGHPLLADRSQLMQAVVNVVMNAVYVAPVGSMIRVSLVDGPGRIGICITDQGPGIADPDLARICDPFYTTKPEGEGTGLGLAITQNILAAHGGELAIDSAVGRGTTVTLWMAA
jgi:PAS domain S-box-containing protein